MPADFRLGESANVPENIKLVNRNYMNLLELPVLFYVASNTTLLALWIFGAIALAQQNAA